MKTRISQLYVQYSARSIPSYNIELWHDGLKKHRLIRGESESMVRLKTTLQVEEWEARWAIIDARVLERSQKLAGKRQIEENKSLALERTAEAQQEIEVLNSLLKATLNVNDAIDWEKLKDKTPYPEKNR